MTTVKIPTTGTVTSLPGGVDTFDYIIVGGGTAGCVIADRLSSYLPEARVLVVEAGPSDYQDDRVLLLKDWLKLLGGDLDYDYGIVEQPRGNSHIRHSRAKVLGGCSSHNTLISFHPFRMDAERWENKYGCKGWSFEMFKRVISKLKNTIQPVHEDHRNQLCLDWVKSCSDAFDIPIHHDFNAEISKNGGFSSGVGFFSVAYNPDDGRRSSSSVAYLHDIINGKIRRPNLTILTNTWVNQIDIKDDVATGITVKFESGETRRLFSKAETILCGGAIDTPRLMLHSGLGPRQQLENLGIKVVKDLPGVGENLQDHPETIIMWELKTRVPENQTTMDSDAGVFLRREKPNAAGDDGDAADIMMHCYQIPFTFNTGRLGYPGPAEGFAFCMTPNIPRPRSRGRMWLSSADPAEKPKLDFQYFTDPEDYDAQTLVAGIKAARKIAEQAPFSTWLKQEVAPGPACQTDEEISEYARRAAHTVYHPVGTTRMGPSSDPMTVVDAELKVHGLKKLRIADAGIMPEIPTINPMVTVLAIGERAAELIASSAGWRGENASRL